MVVIRTLNTKIMLKKIARQNLEASLSTLPPESELSKKMVKLIEKIDLNIWRLKE